MAISLSLVLVLGIAVWVLHKYAGLKVWHGVICVLFGFYLASTWFASFINALVTASNCCGVARPERSSTCILNPPAWPIPRTGGGESTSSKPS